jgi:hypothetical protein
VEIAWTPSSSRKTATDRPGGTKALPAANASGSVTVNFFEGDESTAALGNRNIPIAEKSSAEAVAHSAASPRKSRRGTGSGSRRDLSSRGFTVMPTSRLLRM